jgi:hypothetical protein
VKFRFVERCMFLGGSSTTFGKNESGIYSTAMKSMYPEHEWFSLVVVSLEPQTHRYQMTPVLPETHRSNMYESRKIILGGEAVKAQLGLRYITDSQTKNTLYPCLHCQYADIYPLPKDPAAQRPSLYSPFISS